MAKYRVRPGFTHGAVDQHKAGAVVELTEEEAAGFLDKLEPLDGDERGYLWTDTPQMPEDWSEGAAGPPEEPPSDPPETTEQSAVPSEGEFNKLTAAEITQLAQSWDAATRAALYDYEAAHKNRVTVLEALQSEPEEPTGAEG